MACGTIAVAQIPVTVTITGVDAPGEPSVVGQGYYVRFEVVRAAANPSGYQLYGTITVDDGEGNTCSRTTNSGTGWTDGWSWGCTLTTYTVGVKTLTATFVPLNPAQFGSGSGTRNHTVNQAATTLALASSPDPSVVGETVTLTATVTVTSPGSGSPTGTVTFKNGTTVLGAAALVSSGTSSSQAVFTTEAIPAGTNTITAQYAGSTDYTGSSGTDSHTVSKRTTLTTAFVSDTPLIVNDTATGTVVIQGVPDNYLNPPTGTVTLSHTGTGTLSPTSHTLTAVEGGRFEFTYKPTDGSTTPHVVTASYAGDSVYLASSDTFDQAIAKRAADVTLSVAPVRAYIREPVEISVTVSDDSTAGTAGTPTGTITFSDGGKSGTFSSDTATLSGGACAVTYTPEAWDAGSTVITATYSGSSVHGTAAASQTITVVLRPTQTTISIADADGVYVNQASNFTVHVQDMAPGSAPSGVTPNGTLTIRPESTTYGGTRVVGGPTGQTSTSTLHEWTYSFIWTSLEADGVDYDVIGARYDPNDGIHEWSEGAYGTSVSRRPTVITITCAGETPEGFNVLAQVVEAADIEGIVTPPLGHFVILTGEALDETVVGPAPGPSMIAIDTDGVPIASPTIKYRPNDKVHLMTVGGPDSPCTKTIDSSGGGDGTDGSLCTDGCGEGTTDVQAVILAMNQADVALKSVGLGLDAASIVVSLIPDPVWAAGIVFSSGTEIPLKEIINAVINGTKILLNTTQIILESDLDGDGLPDVVEQTITGTSATDVDSDDDGMGDGDEIGYNSGMFGGNLRPNPTDPDSDADGLLDGSESAVGYPTNVCVADTDCDTVFDGAEIATFMPPTADSGFNPDTWNALGYAYAFPFADLRDQSSPLEGDTDSDGLRDDAEFGPGRLATSIADTDYHSYINDDDSDDDGLQDGVEDANTNGLWDGTVGGTGSTGTGETHVCYADTDDDGLNDGEEVALFGPLARMVSTPSGTSATLPALDTDSDDDGLSDGEEVNVTHTNPLNWDSDGDTLSDLNEHLATGGSWPERSFAQVSDPLDPDSDDDGLPDAVEYTGTGLGVSHDVGGSDDVVCPYVDDDDSDDDGLQDGYEDANHDGTITNTIGDTGTVGTGETDFCLADTDGDGLLDGEEEALFGQGTVSAVTPGGAATTVAALDTDSDDDGLSDGEEVNVTQTDALDWDTDDDTLSDLNENLATGGAWPQRSFSQVSDPLDPDTDDDGLADATEYTGTGMGVSHGLGGTDDLTCTYVNDADSDNDGLQDGAEDANHDGVWSGITLGGIGTPATRSGAYWECDACNPDTDGDGLSDGEEAALLGGGPISQRPATGWPSTETPPGFDTVTAEGVSTTGPVGPNYSAGAHPLYTFTPAPGAALPATVPALDADTDDDGLSDYEEVNTTGTDPLDGDSDNDTLADADELIATGGAWPQRTFDQESDPLDINTDDDYLFDPIEGACGAPAFPGTGLLALAGGLGGQRDIECPFVNNADSDDDGVQDGAVIPISRQGPGMVYSYTFFEAMVDVAAADIAPPGTVRIVVTPATGEQNDDSLCNVCDPDSDGDGLTDGQEIGLGTDPQDWDTDDDGRSDWHEQTGGGPIPTDPFDPDTDDDGLLDSAEVFGSNPTNPVNADTDGDGLCDGGAGTPYMVSGHPTVTVNPICKSCAVPGNDPCAAPRSGSPDGIGDHPNPMGLGEDENGNGSWDTGETDPNQFDTDGDADGDGIEVLGFSTSRQSMIPAVDLFGRTITVVYPDCGCLDPLNPDTDGDSISDGMEDLNHDGNFDFATSDFDFDVMPLLGPPHPDPEETNPCDPDTDHDDLTDNVERLQPNWATVYPFNPTNPLDHDTDNDWLTDGYEVAFTCTVTEFTTLDNDIDGRLDEDPLDGIDNDGDGLLDEDPVDFSIRSVPTLNPTDRDSDSDGYIDGLDEDPCNSELIPYLFPVLGEPADSDGDGFADIDELLAATSEFDPADHPVAFGQVDLDFDECIDDRIWLEPFLVCCQPVDLARAIAIDLDDNVLLDLRLAVVTRNVTRGDFDDDGYQDDVRYVIEYVLSNYRALQGKIAATITDYDGDLAIDRVVVERK
jgi:hypothetical protein